MGRLNCGSIVAERSPMTRQPMKDALQAEVSKLFKNYMSRDIANAVIIECQRLNPDNLPETNGVYRRIANALEDAGL